MKGFFDKLMPFSSVIRSAKSFDGYVALGTIQDFSREHAHEAAHHPRNEGHFMNVETGTRA